MANRLLQFGTYTFPSGWKVVEDANTRVVPSQKLARQDGARVQQGYMDAKQITVQGSFIKGPLSRNNDVRALLDGLHLALEQGPANLYLYEDRYYRNMQAVEFPDTYSETGFNRHADTRVRFIGPEPFSVSTINSSDTWTNPGGGQSHLIAVEGSVPVPPVFTITLSGSGAVDVNITVTNSTTGESFVIVTDDTTGQLHGGDVIVVDTEAQTITVNGVLMMGLFDGQWFTLAPGQINQIDLTITGETIPGQVIPNTAAFNLNQANGWSQNLTLVAPSITPVAGEWQVVAIYTTSAVSHLVISTAGGTHPISLNDVPAYIGGEHVYGRVKAASGAQVSDIAGAVGTFTVQVSAVFTGSHSNSDIISGGINDLVLALYASGGGATISSFVTSWNARYR